MRAGPLECKAISLMQQMIAAFYTMTTQYPSGLNLDRMNLNFCCFLVA